MTIGFFCTHEFYWPWEGRQSKAVDAQKFVHLMRSCLSDTNLIFNWLYYAEIHHNNDDKEDESTDVSNISQLLLLIFCVTGTLSYILTLAHVNRANRLCSLLVWVTRIFKVTCVYPFFTFIFTIRYARSHCNSCDIDAEPENEEEDSHQNLFRGRGRFELYRNSNKNLMTSRLPEEVAYDISTFVDPLFDYVESRIRAGLDIRPGYITLICLIFDDIPQIAMTSWIEAAERKGSSGDTFSNIALSNLILSVENFLYRIAEVSDNVKPWFSICDESVLTVYGRARAVCGLLANSFLTATSGAINQCTFHIRQRPQSILHNRSPFRRVLTTYPLIGFHINDIKSFKIESNDIHDDETTRASSTGCHQVVAVGFRLGKIFHMHSNEEDELCLVQDLYGNFVIDVQVRRVFTSADGTLILTADSTPLTSRTSLRGWLWDSESQIFHFQTSFDLKYGLHSLTFFPNQGDKFATVNKNGVQIWNISNTEAVSSFESPGTTCAIAIDANDMIVGTKGGIMYKYSIASWAKSMSYEGHMNKVTSMCQLPLNEEKLNFLSASFDKSIKMWDVETGLCVRTWKGHNGPVCYMDLLPGLEYFVTASTDWTCKVWSLQNVANIESMSDTENLETKATSDENLGQTSESK